jgi:hypothetical protein
MFALNVADFNGVHSNVSQKVEPLTTSLWEPEILHCEELPDVRNKTEGKIRRTESCTKASLITFHHSFSEQVSVSATLCRSSYVQEVHAVAGLPTILSVQMAVPVPKNYGYSHTHTDWTTDRRSKITLTNDHPVVGDFSPERAPCRKETHSNRNLVMGYSWLSETKPDWLADRRPWHNFDFWLGVWGLETIVPWQRQGRRSPYCLNACCRRRRLGAL